MKKTLLASIVAGLAIFSMGAANAQVTSNFQTTSTITSKCELSAQDISFGEINILNYNGNALGGISVLCSKGVSYTLTPSGGYGDATLVGMYHILRGTATNKDALVVLLNKGTIPASWSRHVDNRISGTGTGELVQHTIGASISTNNSAQVFDSTVTNLRNHIASPDIYTGTVTATVTY